MDQTKQIRPVVQIHLDPPTQTQPQLHFLPHSQTLQHLQPHYSLALIPPIVIRVYHSLNPIRIIHSNNENLAV
jgi:hypothetical protein